MLTFLTPQLRHGCIITIGTHDLHFFIFILQSLPVIEGFLFRFDVENSPPLPAIPFQLALGVEIGASGVVARFFASVRDVEAFIDADDDIKHNNDDLDGEVEDVETCFGKVNWRILARPLSTGVIRANTVTCPEAEEEGGEKEVSDLRSEPAVAEFLDSGLARDDEAAEDEGKGDERDEGVEGLAVEHDIAVDAVGVGVEGIKGLDDGSDEHG